MVIGLDLSPARTGLVALRGGALWRFAHFTVEGTDRSFRARMNTVDLVLAEIEQCVTDAGPVDLIGLENYVLAMGQRSPYQIAEVGGMVKRALVSHHQPLVLVDQGKRTSYVARQTGTKIKPGDKKPIVEWANLNGFPMRSKKRGEQQPESGVLRGEADRTTGTIKMDPLHSRPREDLADAYVVARLALMTLDRVDDPLITGPTGLLSLKQNLFNHPRKNQHDEDQ